MERQILGKEAWGAWEGTRQEAAGSGSCHPTHGLVPSGQATAQSRARLWRPRADDGLPLLPAGCRGTELRLRESVWRKGGGLRRQLLAEPSRSIPDHPRPPRQVHPSARLACCRFWAQHLPCGACRGTGQGAGGRKEPSPPPLPGRVQEHLRQPKYQQAQGWERCASQGWFWSRPRLSAGTSFPAWRGEGDPHSWVLLAPPNRRMGSSVASTGGLLPGHPHGPSPTLSKGADPRAELSPGEQVWPGRWVGEE